MTTIPDVFILESLHPDDEGNGRFEGSNICHVLRMHGKNPKYRYVRSRIDFKKAVKEFHDSKYRYLHISSHANHEGLSTTNEDRIGYKNLSALLGSSFQSKRLFLSACSIVHDEMAKEVIMKTKCYSVVGPKKDIEFTTASVLWPSIYHLIFHNDREKAGRHILNKSLSKAASLFQIKIGYYSISKSKGFTSDLLEK